MPARMIDAPRRLLLAAASVAATFGIWAVAAEGSASAFSWLHPEPTPQGWKTARLPFGKATFVYPRTWRPIRTDRGTVSVALLGPWRSIRGYLNLTPRQGAETLANWRSFRIQHLGEEGSTDVRLIASARGLAFSLGPRLLRDRQLSDDASHLSRDRVSRDRISQQFGHRGRSAVAGVGEPRGHPRARNREPARGVAADRTRDALHVGCDRVAADYPTNEQGHGHQPHQSARATRPSRSRSRSCARQGSRCTRARSSRLARRRFQRLGPLRRRNAC
jgi:hypothetical protein